MNLPKSLKSFSKITPQIKSISEQYEKEKKMIGSVFGEEIATEIIRLEIDKNQLLIVLNSLACYNKIFHQKNYWLSEIDKVLTQSKLNIFDLKVKIESPVVFE